MATNKLRGRPPAPPGPPSSSTFSIDESSHGVLGNGLSNIEQEALQLHFGKLEGHLLLDLILPVEGNALHHDPVLADADLIELDLGVVLVGRQAAKLDVHPPPVM